MEQGYQTTGPINLRRLPTVSSSSDYEQLGLKSRRIRCVPNGLSPISGTRCGCGVMRRCQQRREPALGGLCDSFDLFCIGLVL